MELIGMGHSLKINHVVVIFEAGIMKYTKVLGTLARTYANEHMCIFN